MAESPSPFAQMQSLITEGRLGEAKALGEKALRRNPRDADAHGAMAFLALQERRPQEVLRHARAAIATRWNDAPFIINIARLLTASQQADEAVRALDRAVELAPAAADAYIGLATLAFLRGDLVEYESTCRRGLGHCRGHGGLMRHLAAAVRKQGRMREALEICAQGARLNPDDESLAQEAAFNSNYPSGVSPEAAFEAHSRFGRLVCSNAPAVNVPRPGPADSDRRLRLGFMSADFRQQSVAHFAEPLLSSLDGDEFELYLYYTNQVRDEVTDRFRAMAPNWRDAGLLADKALAAQIARDRVDVLVDLGGLTLMSRCGVLARRPAPVQATYLGYPNTTGLPTVDARLVDSSTDPVGPADRLSVERLVRLDPCFLCYRPPPGAPDPGPAPMLSSGRVTLGCFNALAKFSDACIHTWSRTLRAIPDSRLVLKNYDLAHDLIKQALLVRFVEHGVDTARIDLLPYEVDPADHLRTYQRIDIALDTFPYNGTTTTCEALLMGVPVVSRAGDVHASRVGLSILRAIGLERLVAASDESFVQAVATLAADPVGLARLRAELRLRLLGSVLCDSHSMGRRFGAAIRELWREACQRRP